MTCPTREQIEAARTLAQVVIDKCEDSPITSVPRTLLAATAEPTEEELVEEASEWTIVFLAEDDQRNPYDTARDAYIAGARREGAR